jgi:hypothetical protein
MNGIKTACVWVEDILQWVPFTQVFIVQFFNYEGKRCAEFKLDDKVYTSYIEYKEI